DRLLHGQVLRPPRTLKRQVAGDQELRLARALVEERAARRRRQRARRRAAAEGARREHNPDGHHRGKESSDEDPFPHKPSPFDWARTSLHAARAEVGRKYRSNSPLHQPHTNTGEPGFTRVPPPSPLRAV